MSSQEVRSAIKTAVEAAAAPWPVYDLSDFLTIDDAMPESTSETVLLQYVAASESAMTVGAPGKQSWEEDGVVVVHILVPTGFDSEPTVIKGDQIRTALRGTRLSTKIVIESMEPFKDFGGGSAGLYPAAWHGWASNLFYIKREC